MAQQQETFKELESCGKKNIQDLPDEVLCYVFSFLDLGDLVLGVKRVCVRWKVVAEDDSLWKTLRLTSRTCKDSEIIDLLKESPKLRWVESFQRKDPWMSANILRAIAEYCTELRGIYFYEMDSEDQSVIETVIQQCPKLERVEVQWYSDNMGFYLREIANCRNLKDLCVTSFNRNTSLLIYSIAHGCTMLRSLDLRGSVYNHQNLLYLLRTVGYQLKELSYDCCKTCVNHFCVYLDIARCHKSLEVLRIGDHDGRMRSYKTFFRYGAARNVRELELCNFSDIDATLFAAIFKNCANLVSLTFVAIALKDIFLENIGELHNLTALRIEKIDALTDDAVTHIVQCKSLKKLSLRCIPLLTDKSFVTCCMKLPNLQEVVMDTTAVKPESLLLVPDHLKKLQYLHIHGKDLSDAIKAVNCHMHYLKIVWEQG